MTPSQVRSGLRAELARARKRHARVSRERSDSMRREEARRAPDLFGEGS